MKFNFKKIAPVLASAVLLGSTIGFAVASSDLTAYPASFAGATIVYGADAKPADVIVGADFANDIGSKYGTTSAVTTTTMGGDSVKIETSSEKLNIGENLTTVRTTTLTKSDMPNMLVKKTYQAKDGQTYDYEQELQIQSNIPFTAFRDDDLIKEPVLGIKLAKSTPVLNYTLRFTKAVESDINTNGRYEDIENSDITILGKSYKILNAYNLSGGAKLELMGGAVSDILNKGDNKTYTISGKTYEVNVVSVTSTEAKFKVNGETTISMAEGTTQKLGDGTQIGVRDITYEGYLGGTQAVEFSLGAEKLTLEDKQTVELNDKDVDGLTAYVSSSSISSTKRSISEIRIAWKTSDEAFVTSAKSLTMPGLESVKLSMGDLTTPAKEVIKIDNDGNERVQISVPIKSGTKSFDLLYGNGTKFTGIGKGPTDKLVTTPSPSLIFDEDTDEYFVASYKSGTAGESYLLEAQVYQSSGINYTKVRNTGESSWLCEDKKPTETCTIGNVVLTVGTIDETNNNVNLSVGTNQYLDRIITAEGAMIMLPVFVNTTATGAGKINLNLTNNPASFAIEVTEENKDSAIAGGTPFNVTVGSWTSDGKVQVSGIAGAFAGEGGTKDSGNYYEIGDSDVQVAYVASDLGTKLSFDQGATQDTVTIEYHGGQAYGNVYIASSAATVSSSGGASANVVNMLDTDAETAMPTTNLIVVGGPAVNRVAAKAIGLTTYPVYGSQLTGDNAIAADEAMLKLVASVYDSTKVALVVYGYEAKDTTAAGKYLLNNAGSSALSGKTSIKLVTATGTAVIKP
jgi:hypothetical protein